MFTRDDLIDAILEVLDGRERGASGASARAGTEPAGRGPGPSRWVEGAPKGRTFLSESEIRKALTPGASHLTIKKDAIVSPLALDWLALKGIRIIRED